MPPIDEFELWSLILGYLHNPNPVPLSRPARSALRQNDLVAASRTCVLFHFICHPLLYTHIITDSLPSLFAQIHDPLFRRRFENTKSLSIEYSAKGQHPTYGELFRERREHRKEIWESYAATPGKLAGQILVECDRESRGLAWLLEQSMQQRTRLLFPSLATVAVGSIYGSAPEAWRCYEQKATDADCQPQTWRCQDLFAQFLSTSNLRHLCVRDTYGPLSIPGTASTVSPLPTSIHFTPTDKLPLQFGSHLDWIFDAEPNDDFHLPITLIGSRLRYLRDSHRQVEIGEPLDLSIYCSTPSYSQTRFKPYDELYGPPSDSTSVQHTIRSLTPYVQEVMTDKLEVESRSFLQAGSGPEDEIKWFSAISTPICPSCGSGPGCDGLDLGGGSWVSWVSAADGNTEVGLWFSEINSGQI